MMHNAGFRRLICSETSKILCVVYLISDVTLMIYPKSLSGSPKHFGTVSLRMPTDYAGLVTIPFLRIQRSTP